MTPFKVFIHIYIYFYSSSLLCVLLSKWPLVLVVPPHISSFTFLSLPPSLFNPPTLVPPLSLHNTIFHFCPSREHLLPNTRVGLKSNQTSVFYPHTMHAIITCTGIACHSRDIVVLMVHSWGRLLLTLSYSSLHSIFRYYKARHWEKLSVQHQLDFHMAYDQNVWCL